MNFYDELAWFYDTTSQGDLEYEYNAVLRNLLPSFFNGVRSILDITLAPDQTFTLEWSDAWNFRCIADSSTHSTSYLLSMDKSFWENEPAPLNYSFIVQPENGNHVLIYDNFAYDASIITFESRKLISNI